VQSWHGGNEREYSRNQGSLDACGYLGSGNFECRHSRILMQLVDLTLFSLPSEKYASSFTKFCFFYHGASRALYVTVAAWLGSLSLILAIRYDA
jgi:hypothetical protein